MCWCRFKFNYCKSCEIMVEDCVLLWRTHQWESKQSLQKKKNQPTQVLVFVNMTVLQCNSAVRHWVGCALFLGPVGLQERLAGWPFLLLLSPRFESGVTSCFAFCFCCGKMQTAAFLALCIRTGTCSRCVQVGRCETGWEEGCSDPLCECQAWQETWGPSQLGTCCTKRAALSGDDWVFQACMQACWGWVCLEMVIGDVSSLGVP